MTEVSTSNTFHVVIIFICIPRMGAAHQRANENTSLHAGEAHLAVRSLEICTGVLVVPHSLRVRLIGPTYTNTTGRIQLVFSGIWHEG
ncbi:MAG TPA: hypothetical protein VFE22_06610, partial [Edaphobacter sp.]|nr:hypothetical protein [Edaphobacter sp.]